VKRCLSNPFYPSLESKFSSILFSTQVVKSSPKVHDWKDIAISSIPFLRWYNPMWIISISLLFLSAPQVFPKFILILTPVKTGVSGFQTGLCGFGNQIWPASTPDSSKFFQTCLVIYPDISGLSAKISSWIKIFLFGLSLLPILIYVIMWRFCDA
jgi:hypothetical protein